MNSSASIMNNITVRNQKELRKYRKKIFKSKEECRKIFAKDSFETKLKIAFGLYKRFLFLRKFKPRHSKGNSQIGEKE